MKNSICAILFACSALALAGCGGGSNVVAQGPISGLALPGGIAIVPAAN